MEIIAEVGLAHDGSLTAAHAYIDAISKAGADVAKFQCHLGDTVSEWRVVPLYGKEETRREYWARTGFTGAEWHDLAEHCEFAGVEFMCSPFSVQAVELLNPLVRRWKVPSGQVTNFALLDEIGKTGKPVLLSSGMARGEEYRLAERRLGAMGYPVSGMQCTSMYPCPPDRIGLGTMGLWEGLSDHSGTIYAGLAAAALGCKVLEVHVCFSKEQGGFDTPASITMMDLGRLVEGVRFIERAMQPVDKEAMSERLAETRRIFMVAK